MPAPRNENRVTKAVITAAGYGTRFLPATKAVPKELFPVVDTPAIQYVVEEAAGAGLTDIAMIISRGKDAIADHFDSQPQLEAQLEASGDMARLAAVRRSSSLADLCYIRQGAPNGLGHAVARAATFVGDEPFAVLLGDDLIDLRDDLMQTMLAVQRERGGGVIALMEVPRNQASLYGCVAVEETDEERVVRITDLVEKPPPEEAPSNLAIIGRYVLAPPIFDVLAGTDPGRGGEIQLTDALKHLVDANEPMHGVIFRGRRYDTGDRADYLRTVVRLACEREDIGPDFRAWLERFVAGRA